MSNKAINKVVQVYELVHDLTCEERQAVFSAVTTIADLKEDIKSETVTFEAKVTQQKCPACDEPSCIVCGLCHGKHCEAYSVMRNGDCNI